MRSLRITTQKDDVTLHLEEDSSAAVEEWSFERRAKLFEKVFKRRLRVVAAGPDAPSS